MKTTKKRLVLGIAGAALLCVGAVFTTLAATAEAPITDETMLANIEAISSTEIVDIPCNPARYYTCTFMVRSASGTLGYLTISDARYAY